MYFRTLIPNNPPWHRVKISPGKILHIGKKTVSITWYDRIRKFILFLVRMVCDSNESAWQWKQPVSLSPRRRSLDTFFVQRFPSLLVRHSILECLWYLHHSQATSCCRGHGQIRRRYYVGLTRNQNSWILGNNTSRCLTRSRVVLVSTNVLWTLFYPIIRFKVWVVGGFNAK